MRRSEEGGRRLARAIRADGLGPIGRRFGKAGAAILTLLAGVAVFAPLLAPHSADALAGPPLLPPGDGFLLGTNDLGQDIFSRLVFGARTSLAIGVAVALLATTIGVVVGLSAGLLRGAWDQATMRVVDIVLTIPFLPLLIVLQVFLGGGPLSLVLILGSVLWARPARELRSQVLSVRERGHVQAAMAMGASSSHLLGRHVFPAVAPLVVPQVVRIARSAILLEASLSFLGLGDPTLTSWGTMLFHAQARSAYLTDAWLWWILPPGLAIGLAVLGVALLGYAAEEITRPRLTGSWVPAVPLTATGRQPHAVAAAFAGSVPLEVEDLEVRYGTGPAEVTAVQRVHLRVGRGEVVGLVGESGSGKTTVATASLGLVRQPGRMVGGVVRVGGRSLSTLEPGEVRAIRGRIIALVPQNAMNALNPVRPVIAQLMEAIQAHAAVPGAQAEARAASLLVSVGIAEDRHDAFPHEFSGGMRQRVLIAMALINDPQVLVADEPTTGLDETTASTVLELLDRLRVERGLGVLLVSHDLDVVMEVADRIAIMHRGRVVEEGAVSMLRDRARHPETRRLLGVGAVRPSEGRGGGSDRGGRSPLRSESRSGSFAEGGCVLDVEGLSKQFARRHGEPIVALRDATLHVGRSEIVGLLGRSGEGKTTLARIVIGLEAPDAGRLAFDGSDLTHTSHRRRRSLAAGMHLVFQDPYESLAEHMSVTEIVAEPLRIHRPFGRATHPDWIEEALRAVDLDGSFLDRRPHELSGGERQRVALARAIVLRPRLVIADEPASLLDAPLRAEILTLLADLRDDFGTSILYITHDEGSARRLCDRILVLSRGRISPAP